MKVDDSNPKDRLGALKVPLRLNPGVALVYMALVFELGAWKYGEFNWRNKKVRLTVYSEAIQRHNFALASGEDIDAESGLPHTAHIMACCAIIEDARACNALIDDRFEKDMTATLLNALMSSNYSAAVHATTRSPARSLDEVRGCTPADFKEFLDTVVIGVKERRAKREQTRGELDVKQAGKRRAHDKPRNGGSPRVRAKQSKRRRAA